MGSAPSTARPPPSGDFTTGGLLLQTLQVWWRGAFAYTAVAVLASAPILALDLHHGPTEQTDPILLLAFAWLMEVVNTAAASQGALEDLAGGRARLGTMLGTMTGRLWPVFTASALYAASVVAGIVAFIVPGVAALVAGFVAVPAAIAQPELGPEEALRLSWVVTHGKRIALFAGAVIVLGVPSLALHGLARWLEHANQLSFVAQETTLTAVAALLSSVTSPCAAVAYHQLRACAAAQPHTPEPL